MSNHLTIVSFERFLISLFSAIIIILSFGCEVNSTICNFALVNPHNIRNAVTGSLNHFSVANGEFAFTVDITELKTFAEYYSKGGSPETMSNRRWNTGDNPNNFHTFEIGKSSLKILTNMLSRTLYKI